MFQGEYTNNMDDKGRVNIPAPFRDVLQKSYNQPSIIIARDPQTLCLRAYPQQEWKRLLAKIGARPSNDRIVQAFKRTVISSAQEYCPDKQGRVLIPQNLRDYAGIAKSTVFAGSVDTFEIWDATAWEAQLASSLALLQNQDLDF
ncbi:division/cell wall cluster transcriptional repressor MraZ [Mariprofundus ferrooxydans]|nr:division/cell wall cluster transcriptional repressor MraZ [Mariprofundus ferrooxydans]